MSVMDNHTGNTHPRSAFRLHYEPCNSLKELDEILAANPLWPEWFVQWTGTVAIFKLPILAVAKKRARSVESYHGGGHSDG